MVLSACGVGINKSGISLGVGLGGSVGRHIGLGTNVNIPLTFEQDKQNNTGANSNKSNGVDIIDSKIVTYFDTQGQAIEAAVKGGYYRQLIKKEGASEFMVQDFYVTGEKRTNPMLLNRNNIFEFRAHPKNGLHIVYAINGAVMSQYTYKNNELIQ